MVMADTQLIEIETLTKRFEDHVVLLTTFLLTLNAGKISLSSDGAAKVKASCSMHNRTFETGDRESSYSRPEYSRAFVSRLNTVRKNIGSFSRVPRFTIL